MRFKIFALIACGIILAFGGAFGTFYYTRALELELAAARSSLRAFGETVAIPLVAQDIAPGSPLTPDSFVMAHVPVSYLPDNILRSIPALKEGETLIAVTGISAGNAVFDRDIALAGTTPNEVLMPIGNGKIFGITPRNLQDFSGDLTDGTSVDLVWTQDIGGGKTETRLIATGLRVRSPYVNGQPMPEKSAAAGKLLLEGALPDAVRSLVATQKGLVNIIISDGSRSVGQDIVLIGPTDLQKLPLVIRADQEAGGPSLIGKITGGNETRSTCPTAVVRGAARSVAQVPC